MTDIELARAAARADALLAPPADLLTASTRAEHKAALLAAARGSFADRAYNGCGTRDGIEVETHTVEVYDHPLFPGGLRMADVEPIDTDRARAIADQVAEAIVQHVDALEP